MDRLRQRMAEILEATRDINACVQTGEIDGIEGRLQRRQVEFESFFGDLSADVEVEQGTLHAWIAEIQKLDAEARRILVQGQAELRMNLGRMHDSHAASDAYQATHRMADDFE
ncbi:MAG: flagellar protein FliT [Halothiobacillaceae bacterium]|nr:MAG: flagellar protein FliT [Halothiobacillaceae bacterium]